MKDFDSSKTNNIVNIDSIVDNIREKLFNFITEDRFEETVAVVFGSEYISEVKSIIAEFSRTGSELFPRIDIVTAEEINNGRGAYAASNNTIYLSREFLAQNQDNPEAVGAVLVEEIGHAIDNLLKIEDTPGDEGELFSRLLLGEELTEAELARIQSEDDSAIALIDGETLELEQSNFSWPLTEGYGASEQSVTIEDSEDFFTFSLLATGSTENYVRISSDSNDDNIDLDLMLFDGSGTILETSGSFGNTEELSLAGLAPGNYRARVYNYQGTSNSNPGNADYLLEINLPTALIPQDAYESNDSFDTATVINAADGFEFIENLTIDSESDTDFFQFTTAGISTDEHYVAALFDETAGAVDFNLFDSSGNFLYYAFGSDGFSYIPLEDLPAGTYYIQAGSYEQQTNSDYTIAFNTPIPLIGDRSETENNTLDLGNIAGFGLESDFSIEESDRDFFTFEISGQTTDQHYIGIDFINSRGDLDLALRDSQNRLLDYQIGVTDGEYISLQGLPAGTYRAEVYSVLGETNEYDLLFNAPGTGNIPPDDLESNDSRDTATSLIDRDNGLRQGFASWENLSISQNDEDWFEFELTQEAQTGHYVAIGFDNLQGDLDLELYDAEGNEVARANGTGDLETISLATLPVGNYRARVYGYNGATNPNYTLGVNIPGGDRFEDNNTQEDAKNLAGIRTNYLKTWDNLSISAGDEDWFKFTLPSGVTANDYVGIDFSHSFGDLDLELYDENGLIDFSYGVRDSEEISLQGLAAGEYSIKVFGFNEATSPDYSLTINAPLPATSANFLDRFDSNATNNSLENASDLNQPLQPGQRVITIGNDLENPLSIHNVFAYLDNTPQDVDWFKFDITQNGQQGDYAAISFDHILGDLDLELYNAEEQLLESAEGVSNFHRIGLEDLTAGTYYLKVFGFEEATNPRYTLTVDAPFTEVIDDWSEPDDVETETFENAEDLGILDGLYNRGNLSITENDTDWFKFTLAGIGSIANEVGINFNHQQGDLDIELYGSDGSSLLDFSLSVSNNEIISLNNYEPGEYYLKVKGFNGATNPEYSLVIDAPENTTGDWAEVRGELENNNSVANAYDLREVVGFQTWNTFSLHNGTDEDWYRIELTEDTTANNYAQIFFNNTLADIDLALYDSSGENQRLVSQTADSVEEISLVGLSAGTYYLNVERYSQNNTPVDYQLVVNAPDTNSLPDWAENNDSRDSAEDLQTVESQAFYGLSIHQGGDEDWFKFTTTESGINSNFVAIDFDNSRGNLQLYLYNNEGEEITNSTTNGNRESISFAGRGEGTYYLKVEGADDETTNPNYALTLDVPETAEADWIDASGSNNNRGGAYNLRVVDSDLFIGGLSIDSESDEDWYSFTLNRNGVAGQTATINFDHFAGNLQLQLFGEEAITTADTSRNFEEISLANLGAGTYYLRVLGTDGATNPEYSLNVTGIPEAREDVAEGSEGNDSPALAFDLRDISELDTNPIVSRSRISSNNPYSQASPVTPFNAVDGYGATTNLVTANSNANASITRDNTYASQINGLNLDGFGPYTKDALGFNTTLATPESSQRATQIFEGTLFPEADAQISQWRNLNNELNPLRNRSNDILPSPLPINTLISSNGDFQAPAGGWNVQQPEFSIDRLAQQAQSRNHSYPQFGYPQPGYPRPNFGYNFGFGYPQPSYTQYGGGFGGIALAPGAQFLSSEAEYLPTTPIFNLSLDNAEDEDWFEFTLNNEGAAGQFVAINFNQDLGDLQLELYEDFADETENYQPFLVERANSESNAESISLAGLAPGDYKVRVTGEANPNYTLTVSAPKALDDAEDFTESYNTTEDNPYDLREIEGSTVLTDLSIHTPEDTDWFEFTTTDVGREGHRVSIDFSDTQGDLDLILYDSEGEVARSVTTENFEEVSLEGLAAGTYKFQVFGYAGATNPNYRLLVNAPDTTIESDYLEANNSFANATLLGQNGNVSSLVGLSIHEESDEDYFKFTTTGTGTAGNSISIEHESSQGDLNIELYSVNDEGDIERRDLPVEGTEDNKIISLENLEVGDHYFKVSGAESATNNYQLYLDAPIEADSAENTNDWTVMVYMTTSNLSEQAFETINELEYAATLLPSNVDIAVLWDQSERATTYATGGGEAWGGTGRAIIQPDTDPDFIATDFDTRIGEQNTGHSDSLINFAKWANGAAPAENYSLIMWNHGGGEIGGFNIDDFDINNPNSDTSTGSDRLYTDELTQALSTLQDDGISFDLVAFDACLMAMAEVAYALSDYTDILVGSEEAEEGSGYDYTTALSALFGDASRVTAEDLASSFVDSFQQQYQSNGRGWDTHSAIDLSDDNLNNLVTALNSFTTAALELNENSQWNEIQNSRDNASSFFPAPYYRDLGQFLDEIQSSDALPENLKDAAENASDALNEIVIAKTSDQRNTQGLSVYLPDNGDIDEGYSGRNEEFLNETGWDEFLQALGDRGSDNRQEVPLDWAEANDVAARAFNFNTLRGSGHKFTGLSLHNPTDEDWYRFTIENTAESGDRVRVDSEAVTLSLRYLESGQIRERTAEGREISLEGLNGGEYQVLVKGNGSTVPEYSLSIDAPGTPSNGEDWARGNNTRNKAEELGVITSERVFTGLQLDSNLSDWFEFELAKVNNDQLESIALTIDATGDSNVTARLFDSDDSTEPVVSVTDSGQLELTTSENPSPGATYYLEITQSEEEAAAYALNFNTSESSETEVDPEPEEIKLSIDDISLSEGNEGNKEFTFTVSLDETSSETVTVDYATADDTAIAGEDYTATNGTLTFEPGATEKTVTVRVIGDLEIEDDESFDLRLSNVINAELGDGRGVATITNDDSTSGGSDPDNEFDVSFYRFRNTQIQDTLGTSTYIYVGEAERDFILSDPNLSGAFELEGRLNGQLFPAFTASTNPGSDLIPVYRYRNTQTETGTYLFATKDDFQQDVDIVQSNFVEEGNGNPAFYAYPAGSAPSSGFADFTRFENVSVADTFIYTAPVESENIRTNLTGSFTDQGEFWAVGI